MVFSELIHPSIRLSCVQDHMVAGPNPSYLVRLYPGQVTSPSQGSFKNIFFQIQTRSSAGVSYLRPPALI